jgi:membrane associated rhomboid family serine protease
MGKLSEAIKVIIIVNVALFVPTLMPEVKADMFRWLALYFPKNNNFEYWQFVTNMFMHGGVAHILFNMYGLWAFGTPLEKIWGRQRFLIFYFISGIGAGIIYTAVNYFQFMNLYNEVTALGVTDTQIQTLLDTGGYDTRILSLVSKEKLTELFDLFRIPAVGASGAIYGILVAFAILFPNAKLALIFLPVPIAAKYFIPVLIALDLFSGVTGYSIFGGGVAHFAHVGGAVIGFLLMWYWKSRGIGYYQHDTYQ